MEQGYAQEGQTAAAGEILEPYQVLRSQRARTRRRQRDGAMPDPEGDWDMGFGQQGQEHWEAPEDLLAGLSRVSEGVLGHT